MLLALCLILVLVAPMACAQTGTPNLSSAYVWDGANPVTWTADARFWDGSENMDWFVGFRGRVDDRTEATLGFTAFENRGDDPIGGVGVAPAVRTSHYHAVTAQFKVRLGQSTRPAIALLVGADLTVSPMRSTNTLTGETATSRGAIFAAGLPLQWGRDGDRTLWFLEPKMACYDSLVPTDTGRLIDGFGTIIALGGGVVHQVRDDLWLFADITGVLSGDNSIDTDTNTLEDQILWSAGGRWQPSERVFVEAFATDAAGPSLASSLLAAPDGSVGFGLRASCQY